MLTLSVLLVLWEHVRNETAIFAIRFGGIAVVLVAIFHLTLFLAPNALHTVLAEVLLVGIFEDVILITAAAGDVSARLARLLFFLLLDHIEAHI